MARGDVAIDPVPGEIPEADTRHAGTRGDLERRRWDVGEHGPDSSSREPPNLAICDPLEARLLLVETTDRPPEIDVERAGLDEPHVETHSPIGEVPAYRLTE